MATQEHLSRKTVVPEAAGKPAWETHAPMPWPVHCGVFPGVAAMPVSGHAAISVETVSKWQVQEPKIIQAECLRGYHAARHCRARGKESAAKAETEIAHKTARARPNIHRHGSGVAKGDQ